MLLHNLHSSFSLWCTLPCLVSLCISILLCYNIHPHLFVCGGVLAISIFTILLVTVRILTHWVSLSFTCQPYATYLLTICSVFIIPLSFFTRTCTVCTFFVVIIPTLPLSMTPTCSSRFNIDCLANRLSETLYNLIVIK